MRLMLNFMMFLVLLLVISLFIVNIIKVLAKAAAKEEEKTRIKEERIKENKQSSNDKSNLENVIEPNKSIYIPFASQLFKEYKNDLKEIIGNEKKNYLIVIRFLTTIIIISRTIMINLGCL